MNKLRTAIYLRLSDEDKNKVIESESIKNQRNLLLDEINKHDDFILVDEYCDEDLSGAGTYRPEFERLIKDCELGKIDVVLCKSQSRFSRDMEVIEKYLHNKFPLWNVRFISISDNADTFNIANKKTRQINGLVNEWYLEDVSNNIRSAFQAKMKNGEFISPFAPYGYKIKKEKINKLIIDKKVSYIIKDIYNLYLKGYGDTAIATHLNKQQIPSPALYKYKQGIKLNINAKSLITNLKWTGNAVKNILTNEVYIGNLIQGKRTTISYKNHQIKKKDITKWIRSENTHDAIINKEIFNKVQILRSKKYHPQRKNGTIHPFSKRVYCNVCHSLMRKKTSGKNIYLVCSNKDCFNKSGLRYTDLENIVLEKINNLIKNYFDETIIFFMEMKDKNDLPINSLKKEKKHINELVIKNNLYLKNLFENNYDNVLDEEDFWGLVANYNDEKRILKERLNKIETKINSIKLTKEKISFKNLEFLNYLIIDSFIEKIFVDIKDKNNGERNIQINWNY